MATNRSRRLRKKLCVDEFQELGFELTAHRLVLYGRPLARKARRARKP